MLAWLQNNKFGGGDNESRELNIAGAEWLTRPMRFIQSLFFGMFEVFHDKSFKEKKNWLLRGDPMKHEVQRKESS